METLKIDLAQLRNDAHFQFNTEFRDLLMAANSEILKVKPQFDFYLTLFKQEDEAVKKIVKSALTDEIEAIDRQRDTVFRGLADFCHAALNHFKPETAAAAKHLQTVFGTFGNVARKPLNEETSAIYNLLQELKGEYAADIKTLGAADWVTELETVNNNFEKLVKERYEESAQRSSLVLKEVRAAIDDACRSIIKRIDALMLVEGGEQYADFIRRLNVVIEKYK
jgi:hypothetical protein